MPNSPHSIGLHHVTAIASDAQANLDFYVGVLGLRLVKLTVNFDDPCTYHLYFADSVGSSRHGAHLLPMAPCQTQAARVGQDTGNCYHHHS